MEPIPYELTPAQRTLLQSLARKTDKGIPSLIAEALKRLRESTRPDRVKGDENGRDEEETAVQRQPEAARQPIWEKFVETSHEIPDEELDRLPAALATQVDHYIYGTPKRPV